MFSTLRHGGISLRVMLVLTFGLYPVPPPLSGQEKPAAALKHMEVNVGGAVKLKLVYVEPGKFKMGSPKEEPGREDHEKQHEVEITKGFWMGVFEVTLAQFEEFVRADGYRTEAEKEKNGGWGYNAKAKWFGGSSSHTWKNSGFAQGPTHPVMNVSWNDAMAFCHWLSKKEGKTFDLPTEAEWEYACRAGTSTRYSSGKDDASLEGFCNRSDLTLQPLVDPNMAATRLHFAPWRDGYAFTAPVGSFKPNAWGLYDMHGNVWECCKDWYKKDYYAESPPRDPQGPKTGTHRVMRGGCWFTESAGECRSANRSQNWPSGRHATDGFRVVMRLPQEKQGPAKGIDAATLAAYEKLGAKYGGWTKEGRYFANFETGRKYAEGGLPGFVFKVFPKGKLPDVAVPFGLRLTGSDVTEVGLKEVAALKNLTTLELGGTKLTKNAWLKELMPLKNLTRLSMVTEVTDAGLKDVARLSSLTYVQLIQVEVTDAGLKDLAPLQSLTTLCICWNSKITDAGLKEVANFKNLTTLELMYNLGTVTDTGLKELASLKNLTFLGLRGPEFKVTDAGLKELAPLTKLSFVSLVHTHLTDAALKELATFKNLTGLDLGDSLTDAGMKELATFKDLAYLGLGEKVTDANLKELASLKNLTTLWLRDAQVTDAGLKELANLKSLTELWLPAAKLTDAAVAELRRALPHCEIHH